MHFRGAVNLLASVLIVIAIARLVVSGQSSTASNSRVDPHQQPVLRIYDVRDIWQPLAQQAELRAQAEALSPRPLQIDYAPGDNGTDSGPVLPTTVPVTGQPNGRGVSVTFNQEATDQITAMLVREVTFDDWRDNGGSIASITAAGGGFLMIWHTPAGHRQIETLLAAMRAADRIQWQENGAAAKR